MTKVILHGGNSKNSFHKNGYFVNEIFSGKKIKKILIVAYARNREEWDQVFTDIKLRFNSCVPKQKLKFELSDDNIDNFVKQIKSSDLIFFAGGSEILLKEKLKKIISKITKALDDRIVVGVSAGANIFSSNYYSNDRNQIEEGLGFFKIKTICHYSNEKRSRLIKLLRLNNLPTLALKEKDFMVLYF